MIWISILIIAVLVIFLLIVLFFFKIAFVRGKSNDILDKEPEDGPLKEYFKTIREGIEWYDSIPKEEICIKSYDGLRLFGRLIRADEQSDKVIILFHGYRSSARNDFSCAAQYYNSLGLNIIIADQRSHGKSEGRIITFGVKERYDVCSWVELAKKEFCGAKIYLSGLSMGASTVMMASDIVEGISGIVADCGFTSPKEIIELVAKKRFGLPKRLCGPVGFFARLFCGFDYSYSTTIALAKTNVPVLFIHGAADNFVPCYMSEQSYEACASQKRIVIVNNAPHGFSFLVEPDTVKAALEEFILKNER